MVITNDQVFSCNWLKTSSQGPGLKHNFPLLCHLSDPLGVESAQSVQEREGKGHIYMMLCHVQNPIRVTQPLVVAELTFRHVTPHLPYLGAQFCV